MSNGEWEAELIARRVETMMYPHLDFSFATMCRLIWLTLRGKPLPKEIPL